MEDMDMAERKIRETIQFRGNVYGGVLFEFL